MSETSAILVIENDRAIRDFIFNALTDEGYLVQATETSRTGSVCLPKYDFSMAIMDLSKVTNDDHSFIHNYRARFGKFAPLVITTTNVKSFDSQRVHPDAVLLKPFHLTQLLGIVWQYCGTQNAQV